MESPRGFSWSYRPQKDRDLLAIRARYLPLMKKITQEQRLQNILKGTVTTVMEHNDQEFLVQKIRTQYTEKAHTQLDTLRELDKKVKRPANIIAGVLGSIGAIVMGCGMSLVMTDLGASLNIAQPMVPGIIIGIVGLALALLAYPLHKGILNARKKKFAPQILELSRQLMEN